MAPTLQAWLQEDLSVESWLLTVHRDEDQHEEEFASRDEVFAAAAVVVARSRTALRCITVIGPALQTWCATEFVETARFRRLPSFNELETM